MRAVLLSLVLLLAGPAAWAQPASTQTATPTATREYVTWIERISTLLNEMGTATSSLQSAMPALHSSDRATQLAGLRRSRDAAQVARTGLSRLDGQLQALGPYTGPAIDATTKPSAEALWTDTNKFSDTIDDALSKVIALVEAIERDDAAAITRLISELRQSAHLLIDGQILAVRGRQQLASVQESAYYSLGALVSFYEGMRALIAAPDPTGLRTAARGAASWAANGRTILAGERAQVDQYRPSDRPAFLEMLALEEKGFVVVDQMAATMNAAADEGGTLSAQALRAKYAPRMIALEAAYQNVAQEQIDLAVRISR